jgi:hypothetical protein
LGLFTLSLALLPACGSDRTAPREPVAERFAFTVTHVDTTFNTRDHFIASVEMQLSGEPLAEAMGRDLGGYNRDYACQDAVCSPSMYFDPAAPDVDGGPAPGRIDLAGFSSGVESYEYSKQPMNNIAFESGAGTSLLFGPVLNPDGVTGAAALKLTQDWIEHLAVVTDASHRFVRGTDEEPLGWPGLWPTLQPFSSWDPSIRPTSEAGCSISSDDNPGSVAAFISDDYECNYETLHLSDRTAQVSMKIDPGSSGWTDWKEALWTLNYLQIMHDIHESGVERVADGDLASAGMPGNTVGPGLKPGTYLGSSDIEGFQAGNFLQILDNQAAEWLSSLTTADGKTLGGFDSVGAALAYGDAAPLRWFPGSIGVKEVPDDSGFPRPSEYTIVSSASHLLDLAGLLGAYASVYSLTDQANTEVGGSQPARAYFDGDPFPVQEQKPTGASTLHDRALAMMRVLVVNIARLHADEKSGLLADDASVKSGKVSRGSTLSADVAAYTLLALRTARRSLDSALTLYSNTKPDTAGIPTVLDAFAMAKGVTYAQRLDRLINDLSAIFLEKLTDSDGTAFLGWDLAASKALDDGTSLDAHTAAIRGLLIAYLATGSPKFRDRAERVFRRLESSFYDERARVYRPRSGDRADTITFGPRRFGLLQGALRDTYELVAALPGNESLRPLIEDRVGRLNKLVLNGWDDRDGDQQIEWPDECAHVGTGPDGKPLGLGALQMGERTLTGESGSLGTSRSTEPRIITTDREHDCVPEISAVGLPAALADSVTFRLTPIAVPDGGRSDGSTH